MQKRVEDILGGVLRERMSRDADGTARPAARQKQNK